ncbi:MAG: M20/M25/M40 family metallo-hydrolase [Enterocloster sp.]
MTLPERDGSDYRCSRRDRGYRYPERNKGPGKTVLLRADIDALPIEEKTGLPYASETAGVMHACGHDGHAAWLVGSAMILSKLRSHFPGNVEFVFQPGEENGLSGKKWLRKTTYWKILLQTLSLLPCMHGRGSGRGIAWPNDVPSGIPEALKYR